MVGEDDRSIASDRPYFRSRSRCNQRTSFYANSNRPFGSGLMTKEQPISVVIENLTSYWIPYWISFINDCLIVDRKCQKRCL